MNNDILLISALDSYNSGQYKDTISKCRLAIQNQERADAWCLTGMALRKLGRSHDAVNAYRLALLIDPDYTSASSNLINLQNDLLNGIRADAYSIHVAMLALYEKESGLVVQTGVFKGLKFHKGFFHGKLQMLFGTYESQLTQWMHDVVKRAYSTIINVGCGEGLYAVGLAKTIPNSRVFAFDTHEGARANCQWLSDTNGTTDRVTVLGECSPQQLEELLSKQDADALVLIDCEGCEYELLDPALVPSLANCDILVECHDSSFQPPKPIAKTLEERFFSTHSVIRTDSGPRDPCMVPFLDNFPELAWWLSINESRDHFQTWFYFTKRQ
ncbi:MAG: hypothetical protein HQL60_00215 [Magnetococcales bacterium]|nr:hypothetical protein [Magnetococcales bacterium]